jgi:hypothetical protein
MQPTVPSLHRRRVVAATRNPLIAATVTIAGLTLAGCGCNRPAPPTTMTPPMSQPQQPVTQAPPVGMPQGGGGMPQGGVPGNAAAESVYQWQDVPVNERVPVRRAVFDQGGYQIFAQSGETIVVPFANQNLNVMKFGQSDNGGMYFINENGKAPILYIPRGGYLENTAAANAKWYPFSKDHNYERPVYISMAPSYSSFIGMGWYPGMMYHGGYFGYSPFSPFVPMVGLNFIIGGRPYMGWGAYQSYYNANPYGRSYMRNAPSYRYNTVGRQASNSFGRGGFGGSRPSGSFGGRSSGSGFGRSSGTGTFGRSSGSSGSFGRSSGGGFGSAGRTGGTFGRSGGSTFGTAPNRPSGSFGSGSSSGFGSTGRRSGGSFGSGPSGYGGSFGRGGSFGSGSSGRSSGFGSGRSSGFGGGGFSSPRSSGGGFGGGGFSSGGGRSSFGGGRSSFGGGRRR